MKQFDPATILGVLDRCCDAYTFPMLDNGYVYPAATRLSLFRSPEDWALVIEVFGFSPRAGLPDTHIYTFASRLHNRDTRDKYVSGRAHEAYLVNNPNNDSRFVFPMAEGSWQHADEPELVAEDAREVVVRGTPRPVPAAHEYRRYGIELAEAPRVQVFELCRFLVEVIRDDLLATPAERRISVLPGMTQLLQLDEWHHPNVVDPDDRPSRSATFQQLAQVLGTGDVTRYRPSLPPNTHWRNWPEAGTL
jgi:hypothetical protein